MTITRAVICLASATLWLGPAAWAQAPTAPDSVEAGRKLFKANCVSCHGKEGRGDGVRARTLKPPPRNLQIDPLQGGDTDAQIFFTISNGRPGTAMADFKLLSEEDRWLLVCYVQSLRKKT